jgi:hypothetical protein
VNDEIVRRRQQAVLVGDLIVHAMVDQIIQRLCPSGVPPQSAQSTAG